MIQEHLFYVDEIKKQEMANETIITYFLIDEIIYKQRKNKEEYCELSLKDSTGDIKAFVWDIPKVEEIKSEGYSKGHKIKILGNVRYSPEYGFSLYLDKIRFLKEEEYNEKKLLPETKKDVNKMWDSLREILLSVENEYLRQLAEIIINDENISGRIKNHSASKFIHHAYIGGFLEHNLQVIRTALFLSEQYPFLNRDLMIMGCLFHDIGKLEELNNSENLGYSYKGKLLGHITIGISIVEELTSNIENFPEELKHYLQHIILSHHKEKEFGSPVPPKFLEAIAVHYCDNIDAHLIGVLNFMSSNFNENEKWSNFDKLRKTDYIKIDLENLEQQY